MSYLVLPAGIPDFSKAVISLWFRVPQKSITNKIAQWQAIPPTKFFYVLESTIPLMTFGQPQIGITYEGVRTDIAVYHPPISPTFPVYDTPTYHILAEEPLSPCYIGLYCHPVSRKAFLEFNIQKADHAVLTAAEYNRNRLDFYLGYSSLSPPPGYSAAPGSGWESAGPADFVFTTMAENSYIRNGRPEYFYIETPHEITPDHWHHLLLSFDLSSPCITAGTSQNAPQHEMTVDGTSNFCRLWYAIDDVDHRAGGGTDDPFDANMGRFHVDGGDPNAILTENAHATATLNRGYPNNVTLPAPACSYPASAIPSHGAELGIPAATAYAADIKQVEMAELQIFIGVTLDTAVTTNRRAFVDKDGKPVKPTDGATEDDPRGRAEKLLGKKPDILLHGSSDWKIGKNTGTLGIETNIDGGQTIIPQGQFKPVAGIEEYKPEPALEEHPTV